jgi:hypothetical protein
MPDQAIHLIGEELIDRGDVRGETRVLPQEVILVGAHIWVAGGAAAQQALEEQMKEIKNLETRCVVL